MEQTRTAVAAGDANLLRRTAHTLKSVMRTLGLDTPARIAAELEEMGRSANLVGAAPTVAQLESRIEAVVREAKAFATAGHTR